MEVILKADVVKIGKAGEIVKVNEGYARNFLIATGKAVEATPGNVKNVKDQEKRIQEKKKAEISSAKVAVEKMNGMELFIKRKNADNEKFFGSIAETDIVEALAAKGFKVEKHHVNLEKHIKTFGMHSVKIKMKEGIETIVKVWAMPDEEQKG
ncbi:MAG: 50S ribosomal protein L9 [bacterium]